MGAPKVHSLVDKVYHPTNLYMAWQSAPANAGSGGVDHVSWLQFEADLEANLAGWQASLREETFEPLPVVGAH